MPAPVFNEPKTPEGSSSGALPNPLIPQPPAPARIEDDPNHLLARMIEKRGEKKKPAEGSENGKPPANPEPNDKPAETKPDLGDLIHKTLGFRAKSKEKPTEQPAATAKAPQDGKEEKPKSIVTKRKPAAPVPDPVSIATAAATAAVKAVSSERPPSRTEPVPDKEPELKNEDRHEYEVARYLGESNPKYKGAEKIVLEHVRKAESYAERWEKENPGKVFDPDDDEHNEFYAALEKPWSDHEFRMAETEMAAERVAARKERGSQAKIEELTRQTARQELKPIASQTFQAVAVELAKGVGQDVLDKISKHSFDKLMEDDPITATEIARALEPLPAIIETIIELDDPKGRIPFDPKNPLHSTWNNLVLEKERQYAGVRDDSGRLFATRSEMVNLSPAERKGRFYLTADNLVAELVADATETVKERITAERARQEKIAISLGYVKPGQKPDGAAVSDASNGKPSSIAAATDNPAKPVSPSDNGSPRIDTPASGPKGPAEKALAATAGILFAR